LGDVGSTHGRHCSSGDAVIFSRCSAGVDGWVNFNSLIGIQASRMERAMADCPSGRGRLTVLRHLHVFVSLDCHQFQAIEVRAD
jgi:hypothetical protein